MGDDLMMAIGLRGCRVAWPEDHWPRLEHLLAMEGLLQSVAGWATCRVRCGPGVVAPGLESTDGDLAIVCIPLADDPTQRRRPRWGGPEVWDRNVGAFAIPAGRSGPRGPFHFMFDRIGSTATPG